MTIVEIVGGLHLQLDGLQNKLYEAMKKYCTTHKTNKIPMDKLSDRQRIIAQRLVDSHLLNKISGNYVLRIGGYNE